MPRTITAAAFLTLDGVMQAPGGPDEDPTGGFTFGGWMATVGEEAVFAQIDALFAPPFDLLLGRRTFEIFAAHWPFMPDENTIAHRFRLCNKYVLSHAPLAFEWEGSERLADIDALAAVKAQGGPPLIVQGSSTLYPQLLERGMIDRLILMRFPVVLGGGKQLFGAGTLPRTFAHVETRVAPGGTTISTFEPKGEVETGSMPVPELSAPEAERRRRIAEGSW